MEEALHKRNTDCVYFLASPLTCKKGIECEYRHSEMARLNPRDCWYWLAGSCLNPSCTFRHPPLDVQTEKASESASASTSARHQSAFTVNKTNVPCYYYYYGFCNKGERCSFMHGPEKTAPIWKYSKQASVVVDGTPLEKRISTGNDSGPAPAEICSFGTDPKSTAGSKFIPEQATCQPTPDNTAENHQPTPNHAAEQCVYPEISESLSEGADMIRSNSPIQTEGLVQKRSHKSTDQSSEDQLDDHIEREEWLESSPGFDVLVNDTSENLDYGDEALYLLHQDMEDKECNAQHLGYGYENDIEYDPAYPDLSVSFEQEMPDWYENAEGDICNTRKTFLPARERVSDRTFRRKRKLLQTECDGIDLRDYLKKRRMAESKYMKIFMGRPRSSRLIRRIQEKASIGGRGHLRGRLASKVEISVESRIETGTCSGSAYQHGRSNRPRTNRSRQQNKEANLGKRQILSEIFGKTASRKKRSTEESTMFTGPKTLAQIKEEKEKAIGGQGF